MTRPPDDCQANVEPNWNESRREQLRRWAALPLRDQLRAVEEMAETAHRLQQAPTIVGETGQRYESGTGFNRITLSGCAPTPLASYLKALGVFRLVAEQADPEVRGWWQNERFQLETSLDANALRTFLLERYAPTAVLSPWNGGSGFYPTDSQVGIEAIETGSAARFGELRTSISAARDALRALGITAKPDGAQQKATLLKHLRARWGDRSLHWLDASVLLTEESPKYPPLLGTGGNDGRLDFSNNFLQRLTELFDPYSGNPRLETEELLREALFAATTPGLGKNAIGQFSPGAAGGANAGTGFSADSLVNPWDFVLMLEGSLLFAAAAVRRLETSGSAALSFPFTVRSAGSGSGATGLADEAGARAEIWLPLWSQPSGAKEIAGMFAEGRMTLHRQQARDGLDVTRAVASLGVDRGIDSFQRYAFLMRSGLAYLATPLNRLRVRRRPEADLIDDLDTDQWLSRFRRLARAKESPARLGQLAHRLEDGFFELTGGSRGRAARSVLVALGEIQLYLAQSPKGREACGPVPPLRSEWIEEADDGTPAFGIATALAGLHARVPRQGDSDGFALPMAPHLSPVAGSRDRRWWSEGKSHEVVWSNARVEDNLRAVLIRRLLDVRDTTGDRPLHGRAPASLHAVFAWLADPPNGAMSTRIGELLPGLALARIPGRLPEDGAATLPVPLAYAVLKPLFCPYVQLRKIGYLRPDATLPLPPELIRQLAAGRVDQAVEGARRRLRASGVPSPVPQLRPIHRDGPRLLAALMVPISDRGLKKVLRALPVDKPREDPNLNEDMTHAD